MQIPARATAESTASREPDSPQLRATVAVARVLLQHAPGERIPNVAQLRAGIGVGAGTVQKALQELQLRGTVTLDSKQRQGTFVVERRLGELWKAAALPAFSVLLPLPNSWEFQGLATGLRVTLDAVGMPSTFLFGHGSEQRAEALRTGLVQLAVMSNFAADELCQPDSGLAVEVSLEAGSYYAADSVIVLARVPRDRIGPSPRIGIDPQSPDHIALTRREFPDSQYVDISYSHIPSALTRGIVDAAVWHRSAIGLSVADQDLVSWTPVASIGTDTDHKLDTAALVINRSDHFTKSVLASCSIDRVTAIQATVVAGETLPAY